ncbi:MAG TPA: hypothetical protein PLT82_11820 [Candidatus Hydrogenedens sp.]|nr:hypothetical protein [Candidatus Hydrogenedens sp.]HOL21145.1 hypothetical protein [Candidatus Hydrogenedens sp.]HPP59808.1 hypothetical protein [Candidatus Hydrogenedens sp.]
MQYFINKLTLTIILTSFLASCSNSIVQENKLKGEFRILEVQPISDQINNIIKNGSFTEWLSGTRVPSGFLPPFSQYSYVNKKPKKGTGYEVVQKWVKADAGTDVSNMFRISLSDLQPNNYIFSVNATLIKGPKVIIGLWKVSDPGKAEPFIDPLIEISGELNKPVHIEKEIKIEQADTYILCTYAPEGTPQIAWSDWILTIASTDNK